MGEADPVRSGAAGEAVRIPSRRRRSSSRRRSSRQTRTRLRALYFSLAALWGFLAGTGAVLVGLSLTGRPAGLNPSCSILIAVAGGLALVGGLVAATAYRSATRRYR